MYRILRIDYYFQLVFKSVFSDKSIAKNINVLFVFIEIGIGIIWGFENCLNGLVLKIICKNLFRGRGNYSCSVRENIIVINPLVFE
jgi:hypothetical protein